MAQMLIICLAWFFIMALVPQKTAAGNTRNTISAYEHTLLKATSLCPVKKGELAVAMTRLVGAYDILHLIQNAPRPAG